MAKDEDDVETKTEKRFNFYATIFFVLFMTTFGVPLWWKTTSVVRSFMSRNEIRDLHMQTVVLPVNIKLVFINNDEKALVENIAEKLKQKLASYSSRERLMLKIGFTVEHFPDKYVNYLQTAKNAVELDEKIFPLSSVNLLNSNFVLSVVFLPKKYLDVDAYFGTGSMVYVPLNADDIDGTTSITERTLLDVYLNEPKLMDVMDRNLKNFSQRLTDKSSSRIQTNLEPKYTFEISLVAPDPANCLPDVDSHKIFQKNFEPFVDMLKPLIDVKFKSQVLYYVNFDTKPKRSADESYFFYDASRLPHLINSLETYVGGFDAEQPIYRFLIYLTPPSQWPLYVNNDENQLRSDFVISSWGGVIVYNTPDQSCSNGTVLTSLSGDLQNMLIAQIRHLLGVDNRLTSIRYSKTVHPLALWEAQSLLHEAALDFSMNAIGTLNSLVELLDQIGNIVIMDKIGSYIQSSLSSIHDAFESFDRIDFVSACTQAKLARHLAERAFFDESLLAFLYFPDDQKYAIYIPLFLPVGFPVLLSIRQIVQYIRGGKKEKKD